MQILHGVPISYDIAVKPWWMRIINGSAIVSWGGKYVYTPNNDIKELLEDSRSNTSLIEERSLLVHEGVHVYRQHKRGWYSWAWNYTWDKQFRYAEELIATKYEISYLYSVGRHARIEYYAEALSSSMYGNMATLGRALCDLKNWFHQEANPPSLES